MKLAAEIGFKGYFLSMCLVEVDPIDLFDPEFHFQ